MYFLGRQGTLQQLTVEVVLREGRQKGRTCQFDEVRFLQERKSRGPTFSIFSHDSPVLAKISAHFLFLPL